MKMYATIQSERATKGQGGNKYLEITIQGGDFRDILMRLNIEYRDNNIPKYGMDLLDGDFDFLKVLKNHIGLFIDQKKQRLEYLRKELQAERISYEELAELQALGNYIKKDDVELLETAGVPENNEKGEKQKGKHDKVPKLDDCKHCSSKMVHTHQ